MRVPKDLMRDGEAAAAAGLLGRIRAETRALGMSAHAPCAHAPCAHAPCAHAPCAGAPPRPRPAAGERGSAQVWRSTFNRLMVTVMVLATLGTLASGTLASFTAQATNPGNTFETGTLALQDNTAGTICFSYGTLNALNQFTNNNSNPSCNAVSFATGAKPGDPAATANVILQNVGSLDASTLQVSAGSCATANNTNDSFHGGGDLCGAVQVYVQEYTDGTFTTPTSSCVYPASSTAPCGFSQTLSAMVAAGPVAAAGGLGQQGSTSPPDTRYFQVALQLPASAGNSYQGMTATFSLTWYLSQ